MLLFTLITPEQLMHIFAIVLGSFFGLMYCLASRKAPSLKEQIILPLVAAGVAGALSFLVILI